MGVTRPPWATIGYRPDPEGQTGKVPREASPRLWRREGNANRFCSTASFPRKRPRNLNVGHGAGQPRCAAQPRRRISPYNRRRTTFESRPGHSLRNFGFSRAGRAPRLQAGDVRRSRRGRGTRRRPGRDAEARREICGKAGGGAADAVPADPAEHDPRPFPPPEGPQYVDDAALRAGERRRKGRRFRSAGNFGRKSGLQSAADPADASSRRRLWRSSSRRWRGCRHVNGRHSCCVTGKNWMSRKLPPPWAVRRAA